MAACTCQILFLLVFIILKAHGEHTLRQYKPGDVIIGALLNLHLKGSGTNMCGEFHPTGLGFAEVLDFTVDKINNDPLLLPNVTLGYDIRDYCDNPMLAVKWAYDFVTNVSTNRIAAVIGPEDSNTAIMVAGLLQVKDIPLVSFAASSEELSAPMFRSFFRTIPPDNNQAKSIADIIDYFNWTYVAAAAVDHSYGRYGIRALETEADNRKSFCLAFAEYFTRTGYKNKIQDIVARLKSNANIKVIVLWSTEVPARRFLQEAMRQRLEGRTFLISESLATNEGEFFDKYSTVIDGCLGTVPYYKPYPEYDEYIKRATPKSTMAGPIIDKQWWKELWEYEFNCSFSKSNEVLKSSSCSKYENQTMSKMTLEKMYSAFSAKLVDAVFAVAQALDSAYRCAGNRSIHEGKLCPPSKAETKPSHVTRNLHNISFKGLSGNIQFDENGDPQAPSYQIINAQNLPINGSDQMSYRKVVVGIWNEVKPQRLTVSKTMIKWRSRGKHIHSIPVSVCNHKCPPGTMQTATKACCWQCLDCSYSSISASGGSPNCSRCPIRQKPNKHRTICLDLPIENLRWDSVVSISMLVLSATGLLLMFLTFVVYLRLWNTPIVKASSRELTCILFVSISSCFVLAILYLARPTQVLCMIMAPLRYIGYSVCISVLLLKTAQIFQAFQVSSQLIGGRLFGKNILQGKRSMAAVALVNVVQVTLAVMWLLIDPPTVYEDIRPQIAIFVMCKPYKHASGNVLQMTMLMYLVLLAGLSTFYSFKARRIPENFNEARGIVFSLYILILSWIVYYPVHFALDGWYVAVVSNAATLLSSYGLLICIFFPKLYVIFWHPERNTIQYVRAEVAKHTMHRVSLSFSSRNAEVTQAGGIDKPRSSSTGKEPETNEFRSQISHCPSKATAKAVQEEI